MDNITHTLTAVALSHAGLNRKTRFATLAVIAGANLPDIDIISWADGTATYLQYHRGITHSLLGVVVLGGLAGTVFYYLGRRLVPKKSVPPLSLSWLLLSSTIGTGSHLLLDFTNAYGVRPFLPFSARWYAWDIMFIFDPVLHFLLIVGLGLPWLFRLISEEVGARKPAYRPGAIFALSAMVMLWGVRDLAHRRVVNLLDSYTYNQENPRRLGVYPSPANPFAWTGVVETYSGIHVLPASALENEVDLNERMVFRYAEITPPLEAALKTRTASIFLKFAQFPWGQAQERDDGYEVLLRDLRFYSFNSQRIPFVMDVKLDKDLRVRSESFSFTDRARSDGSQEPSEGEVRGSSFAFSGTTRAASRL